MCVQLCHQLAIYPFYLINNKDVIAPHEQQNVVYLNKCIVCPKPTSVYGSQTSRIFSLRKREHELSIKNK